MQLEIISFKPTYSKDSGINVFNLADFEKIIPFEIKYNAVIELPSKSFGGNHSHPRLEAFFAIGDLTFIWIDEKGHVQKQKFNTLTTRSLICVPPHLPHAVVNHSKSSAVLYEFANADQYDVKVVEVYKPTN